MAVQLKNGIEIIKKNGSLASIAKFKTHLLRNNSKKFSQPYSALSVYLIVFEVQCFDKSQAVWRSASLFLSDFEHPKLDTKFNYQIFCLEFNY